MVTNPEGEIVAVNERLCHMNGYVAAEVIGRNPRIFNSGHHPPEFFTELWNTLRAGRVVLDGTPRDLTPAAVQAIYGVAEHEIERDPA